jgi:hypothetical protein
VLHVVVFCGVDGISLSEMDVCAWYFVCSLGMTTYGRERLVIVI